MTYQQIEEQVRKEYAGEKYKALCEMECDTELRIAYLKTPEGRKFSVEANGEASYEASLNNLQANLDMTRANKKFLENRKKNQKKG